MAGFGILFEGCSHQALPNQCVAASYCWLWCLLAPRPRLPLANTAFSEQLMILCPPLRWSHVPQLGLSSIPSRPPGYQFILWDTNAKINGLVAEDLETLVSQVLSDFPYNTGFANGLFVMTTATDHKNNLNRSGLKKDYARTLRVETIANSAGGTAAVAMVAQPSAGFLNGRFNPDGSPTEDTEDCLGRITVGLTRAKSLTLVVSPLDMMGLIGMAQVLATLAYGLKGLRRGVTTWDWPSFNANPEQENNSQMDRWSLNETPSWSSPPLAIANKYHDHRNNQTKNVRYRLILVRASDLDWLWKDRLKDLQQKAAVGHNWIPVQHLPYDELILFAYAADRSSRPTYVCLPPLRFVQCTHRTCLGTIRPIPRDYTATRHLLLRWVAGTSNPGDSIQPAEH